jgi:hypothetical protein
LRPARRDGPGRRAWRHGAGTRRPGARAPSSPRAKALNASAGIRPPCSTGRALSWRPRARAGDRPATRRDAPRDDRRRERGAPWLHNPCRLRPA